MFTCREPGDCVSRLGWMMAICVSFFCAFKLPSRRAFLSWAKSLKEVFYKFFNESRTLAFSQRKIKVHDYHIARFLEASSLIFVQVASGNWTSNRAWLIWMVIYQNQCAGGSLLRKILVQLQIWHHLLHLLHLCIAWLCSGSERGKEIPKLISDHIFLLLLQFFCCLLPFSFQGKGLNLQTLLGCPTFMYSSVKCVLWRRRDQNFTDAAAGSLTSREIWQFTPFHSDTPATGAQCQRDPA